MFNNLCQEIFTPTPSLNIFHILETEFFLPELEKSSSFVNFINLIIPENQQELSFVEKITFLANIKNFSIDNYFNLGIQIQPSDYKPIIELFADKENTYFSFFAESATRFLDPEYICNNIQNKFGLSDDLFIKVFKSLDNRSFYESKLISQDFFQTTIFNYLKNNYFQNPEYTFNFIQNLASINTLLTPVIMNSFKYGSKFFEFTAFNPVQPINYYDAKNSYNTFSQYEEYQPQWFKVFLHIAEVFQKKEINSFDFINISTNWANIHHIINQVLESKKTSQIENIDYINQLSELNPYVSNVFLSHFVSKLNIIIANDYLKPYQAAQWSALMPLFIKTINDLVPSEIKDNTFKSFYAETETFKNLLREKFSNIVKDDIYNISNYGLILNDLYLNSFLNESSYLFCKTHIQVSNINKSSSTHFFSNLLTQFLNENLSNINVEFSYTSLLNKNIDFDIFGNYSLLYHYDDHNFADPFVFVKNPNISIYHQTHNSKILEFLTSNKFSFLSSISDFTIFPTLYEYANEDIKKDIAKEMKELIHVFSQPLTTQCFFLLNPFIQFNLVQDQDLQYTSLFQQMLFRNNNIGLPMFTYLFFQSNGSLSINDFLDKDTIPLIAKELQNCINLSFNTNLAINLYQENKILFSDKSLLIKSYLKFINFISTKPFDQNVTNDLISFNNTLFSEKFSNQLFGFDNDDDFKKTIHTLSLKLALKYKERPIKVKQKI